MKLGENGDQIQQAPVGILSSESSTNGHFGGTLWLFVT
jgi:hypothetical protein